MAVPTEYIARLCVHSAKQLPKTDALSKIDSYIVLTYGAQKFKTRVHEDDDNPTYDQMFFPVLAAQPGGFLQGTLDFQLWDSNTFRDSHVASVSVDLTGRSHVELQQMQLTFVYVKSKYQGQSFLNIQLQGYVQSYASLTRMLAGVPGFTRNDAARAAYVPLPGFGGALYVGLEWEETGELDVKLLETSPNTSALFTDLLLSSAVKTKTRRREFPGGKALAPGLVAYEEVKLDDVKIGTDFNALSALIFDAVPSGTTNAARVVAEHGWHGAHTFQTAKRALQNIDVDDAEEEVFMTVGDLPGEVILVIDWDKDNVDIKLGVLPVPATMDKAYELTIRSGGCNKRVMELFAPPKPKLGGKYAFSQIFQLDDVPFGSSLDTMAINRYQLSNMRSFNIQQVTRVMG